MKKISAFLFCLIIMAGFFAYQPKAVSAITPVTLTSELKSLPLTIAEMKARLREAAKLAREKAEKALNHSITASLANTARTLLNQFAFETATYIGSGSQGQKPKYYIDSFGPWLNKQVNNVGGKFIEDLSYVATDKDYISKYGLCAPDFSVQVKLSLGLQDYSKESRGLTESQCNLAKIRSSYENAALSARDRISLWTEPGYLGNLASTSFDPATTDIGVSMLQFGKLDAKKLLEESGAKLTRTESLGWLNIDTYSGKIRTAPGEGPMRINNTYQLMQQNFGKTTGDLLVDASNIFLNQLALTAFQTLMSNLTKKAPSGTAAGDFYGQGNTGGVTEVERRNNSILQAKFNVRADYNVLGQLTTCTDENNAGPTNCVIQQPFVQAITSRLTVAEAIDQGLLDGNARVGYKANGDELSFKEGYPYRSLIILRKYRVLPVGWEMAAEYIKTHPNDTQSMNLRGLVACFADNDQPAWCRGLIDPHWVLKLPQMFCGMEGYGAQILTANVFQDQEVEDTVVTTTTDVAVSHIENYCADEQSCIKEAPNGTCLQYGYCTEEKRQWIFSATDDNSCEPRNNTCQSFTKDGGDTTSYLENTLDYRDCDASQVGCKRYASVADAYNKDTDTITWNKTNGQLYFNKDVSQCQANGEGCHEFIRFSDSSANLVSDGSFEQSSCVKDNVLPTEGDAGPGGGSGTGSALGGCLLAPIAAPGGYLPAPNNRWFLRANGSLNAGIVTEKADNGNQSLYIEGNGGLYSKDNGGASLLPTGFAMEADTYYVLQANIFVVAGTARLGFGEGATGLSQETTTTGSWAPYSVKFYNSAASTVHDFFIEGTSASARFYVDGIQLSKGSGGAGYSEYGESNVIYEKLLPAYLEATCYVGAGGGSGIDSGSNDPQFQLKPDAPQICFKYARKCSADEVGCQSYTAASGVTVTAKAKTKDACPSSCVGYDTFVQQANFFDVKRPAYFIPTTARSCSAQAAGCTAFTNLDALDKGGEAVEYYTQLRRCIKPDTAKCGQFYTWEGSDESGYQLRVFSLNKIAKGTSEEPKSNLTPAEESQICNEAVFQKLPGEIGYNFDCRQFYAQDGSVSYHLLAQTITCSEDCHPYRREATQTECNLGKGDWDGTRCIYNVIPSEGTRCAAVDAGCQEYTGNVANNTRTLFTDTFEFSAVPTDNWAGGEASSTALNPGGSSLLVRGRPISKQIGNDVKRATSYNISFLAKAAGANTTITGLKFQNKDNQAADFSVSVQPLKTDWQLYSYNLSSLDHEITANNGTVGERLIIEFSGQVYIDNIKLTAVPNRYYLIKDSWNTPSECDQDFTGAPAGGYMLGCSQYQKDDRTTVTLRSFSSLCQDSAAGCEAMIDTKNSSGSAAAGKTFYNDANGNGACEANELNCFQKTAADSVINVVYDPTKLCGGADKGCQRLATVSVYDTNPPVFKDVYIRNNPDAYDSTVCKATAVGCTQWSSSGGGTVFFKDPGEEACEWKLKPTSTTDYGWFKKGKDTPCDITYDKTIGLGGAGSGIAQPKNWAGLCAAEQAGCSEYIDPLSKFNENIILNPSYLKSTGNQNTAESWRTKSPTEASQVVTLTPQTLYVLKDSTATAANKPTRVKIVCSRRIQVLQEDNSFADQAEISYASGASASRQFYIPFQNGAEDYGSVQCTVWRSRNPLVFGSDEIYLRQAVTAYQLRQNLDRTSHNNLVNFDKGAILFNERVQSGVKKASLTFNADSTYETSINGAPPIAGSPLNANVLLKVQPDRTCSQWLDCITYIPDPSNPNKKICLDIGECQSLNTDGSCAVRVTPERRNRTSGNTAFANLTGYSKVGYAGIAANDYYQFSAMTQVGGQIPIADGGFESTEALSAVPGNSWKINVVDKVKRINGPKDVATEDLLPLVKVVQPRDVKFLAPEGLNFLKLSNEGVLTSKPYPFQPGARYVLSFYSYSKGGELDVQIKSVGGAISDAGEVSTSIPRNDQPQKWTRRSVGFVAGGPSLQIVFSADGEVYLDDVKVEVSLNTNCSKIDGSVCATPNGNQAVGQPRYVAPSCRLYPTDSAVDCSVKDENDITTQGVKGYCLESDPRNPGVCLMWYPVDRISGDAAEEGAEIKFDKKVFYCIDAVDQCSSSDRKIPEFFCNQFVQVDSSSYWNSRLSAGSSYALPNPPVFPEEPVFYPTDTRKIDFGVVGGGVINIPAITGNYGHYSYFGSLLKNELSGQERVVVNSSNKIDSFLPYYASKVGTQRCSETGGGPEANLTCSGFTGNTDFFFGCYDGRQNSKTIPGQWDVCLPSVTATLDLGSDDGCGYVPNDIDEIFGVKYCSFEDMTLNNYSCLINEDCVNGPCANCGNGNIHAKQCSTRKNPNGTWDIINDDLDNSDETACIAHCFNTTKQYNVAKTSDSALDAIRRIFVGNSSWKLFDWNGTNAYVPKQGAFVQPYNLTPCNQTGVGPRPNKSATPGNNADYCYIKPIISNYAINGASSGPISVTGREYKTFSFETKTDPEQLPIRRIVINFGYKIGAGANDWATYEFAGTNFADRLRNTTVLYDYSQIPDEYNLELQNDVDKSYSLRPSVTITDNWGISHTVNNIQLTILKEVLNGGR